MKEPSSHFDRLFGLAKAGDWDAVHDYKVIGINSYSKLVERYHQDFADPGLFVRVIGQDEQREGVERALLVALFNHAMAQA